KDRYADVSEFEFLRYGKRKSINEILGARIDGLVRQRKSRLKTTNAENMRMGLACKHRNKMVGHLDRHPIVQRHHLMEVARAHTGERSATTKPDIIDKDVNLETAIGYPTIHLFAGAVLQQVEGKTMAIDLQPRTN